MFSKRFPIYHLFYTEPDGYPVRVQIKKRALLIKTIRSCRARGCSNLKVEKQYA
jgi:hypothetical protein